VSCSRHKGPKDQDMPAKLISPLPKMMARKFVLPVDRSGHASASASWKSYPPIEECHPMRFGGTSTARGLDTRSAIQI